MARTLDALTNGPGPLKWVVAIEGCKYLLSDAPSAAVLSAWQDYEWSNVIEGLFVDLEQSQKADPWDPFASGGKCRLRVKDDDGSDTFGIYVNRRSGGGETSLTATCDRNDTTITVASTVGFTESGEAYVGTECFAYSSTDPTAFNASLRGKYSPLLSGTGGSFSNHHRVSRDSNHVAHFPTVSQLPRVWIGKRVGVYLHTWNEVDQELNSRSDAQLVFAGRIAGLDEDPNTFETVMELAPIQEEIREASCGRDMFSAQLAGGIYLQAGRKFVLTDWEAGTPAVFKDTVLEVVSSGATGTDQINAGWYDGVQICDFLSSWLGAARAANEIYGYYTFAFAVSSGVGRRSKIYWGADNGVWWMDMPGEIAAFLGFMEADGDPRGQTHKIRVDARQDDMTGILQGDAAPYSCMVFAPNGPGFAQEFNESLVYELVDDRGTFVDQSDSMPGVIRSSLDSDHEWGVFLFAEKILVIGAYDDLTAQLTNVWVSPYQLTGSNQREALSYVGVRVDESNDGPPHVRQVYLLEGSTSYLLKSLFYSTGTVGWNHAEFDNLPYGIGLGLPGSVLKGEFERSLNNLPGANSPLVIMIDEPTKFSELIGADLLLRRAFLRWKDEGLEFALWRTPLLADAIVELTEDNKSAPSGNEENHRVPTREDATYVRPLVKIDYSRDFAVGRTVQYLRSFSLEDQTATDDAGGNVRPYTLKMRNTYSQWSNTGAGVESLVPGYLATMPLFSRPGRTLVRSVEVTLWERLAPGDVVSVSDEFARDPVTGRRSISERPAMVLSVSWNPGGGSANGSTRQMTGEIQLMFIDLHRGSAYPPCADVDFDDFSGSRVPLVVDDIVFTADNTTETFTAVAHTLETGDGPINVFSSGGVLPAGLLPGVDYWIIRVDDDNFQLASTLADTVTGTEVPITNDGTGTLTLSDTAFTERGTYAGGHVFDSGYDDATATLRTVYHAYSSDMVVPFRRFGSVTVPFPGDGSYLEDGDEVLIIERDPDDPATALKWTRTLDGDPVLFDGKYNVALTAALSSPAFDNTKRYRIVPAKWSEVQTSQKEAAFQADSTDLLIEDDELAFHFASSSEPYGFYNMGGAAELLPDEASGDGRPWDVGHDAALIRTLNAFIDYKSAHQAPCYDEDTRGQGVDIFETDVWVAVMAGPIFLGLDHIPGSFTKSLTIAPFMRSNDGSDATVRVTLSRDIPSLAPSAVDGAGALYFHSRFGQHFSQQEWTTTSTSWSIGSDKTLDISVKDLQWGVAWLTIETKDAAQCRGLARCYEGPRVISTSIELTEDP